ncbi:MAG: O-antigen ligase family protein [Gloeocapsa sp. UFS-A4-WI-NPMV-4B04]|nr:O-antigen ligase family protein [Gloeocapsa sp. UFS-A4-WI-NPMV-4B04]
MNSLEITWVAVGLALSHATQLRPAGLPIGPGEVMLFIWMLLVGIRLLIHHYPITHITKVIFWFWVSSFTAMSLGFLIAESKGLTAEDFDHDGLSFGLAFIFSLTFSIAISSKQEINKLLAVFVPFTLFCLVVILLFPSLLPFINPWYGEIRFSGWSDYPNQLALQLSMIPFFALHLLNQSSRKATKIWYIFLIIISLYIGIATGSDALQSAWVIGFGLLIFFAINRKISNYSAADKSLYLNAINRKLQQLLLVIIILTIAFFLYTKFTGVVGDEYDKDAQGSTRFILWLNGIAAISYSPIFGLGPGSQSGFTGPFFGWEAHNTFIDWAGDSGIVGLVCYVALLGWIGWNAWKRNLVIMLVAIISLVGFSVFHYMLRPPTYWFYLLTIAKLSTSTLKERDSLGNVTKQIKKLPSRLLRY